MKELAAAAVLLVVLLAVSLWVGSGVQRATREWVVELEKLTEMAEDGSWSEMEARLFALYRDWARRGGSFHLVMEHRDLDEVEELFAGAVAACAECDGVEFRMHIERLRTRLMFLAETQQMSLKNIL